MRQVEERLSADRRDPRRTAPTPPAHTPPPSSSPVAIAAGPAGRALLALASQGGWWASDRVLEALAGWSPEDDRAYREDFRTRDGGAHHYEEARIGYVLGHIAGHNPTCWAKPFEEIDRILTDGSTAAGIDHERLRPYIKAGFERARYRWGRVTASARRETPRGPGRRENLSSGS